MRKGDKQPARLRKMWKSWIQFEMIILVALFLVAAEGTTDPDDVSGLTVLYSSFNSPTTLNGWKSSGGDPCQEGWEGITCSGSQVTEIKLPSKNLGGSLGYALDKLKNLVVLDLSHNVIGQPIPYQMPPQLKKLYLSYNQLTGLPYSLRTLSSLTDVDVSYNQLGGQILDVFQNLTNLASMDLSNNKLSNVLPSSFSDLTGLNTLYLQNNQLTGTINVLAELPLKNLNIENNQFTGWVPSSLLTVPNFRSGGNQFNTSPAPPPPPYTSPPPKSNNTQNSGKHSPPSKSGSTSSWTGGKVAGISIAAVVVVTGVLMGGFLLARRSRTKAPDAEKLRIDSSWSGGSTHSHVEAVDKEKGEQKLKVLTSEKSLKPPPSEKFKPAPERSPTAASKKSKIPIPATVYSVADLQVATNSFGQENLIGEGSLGRVYRAEFPNGKVLVVKKLDLSASAVQNEEAFLAVVSNIAKLRHANVTELVGYCTEHGQRLLVYEHFEKGTLFDVLHPTDENCKRLSWNQRVKVALGAAKALEYLHEIFSPAVVHRNFKSANILLDNDLNPHLSDCGIASLTPTNSERQVAANIGSFGYSAPEYAMSGVYTAKSDVYSFGVVMLELLTGRKSLDSSRTRAEQSLVRWAIPQLHDIDALSKMVDPALKGIYPARSLSRFADMISLCVQPEPEFRPPMSEVVQSLVRLMQRASLSKRSSGDDVGASQRSFDRHDNSDS